MVLRPHDTYIGKSRGDFDALPLHLAVSRGAGKDVVQLLLDANKEAAKTKDGEGDLPLHYCTGATPGEVWQSY